MSIQRWILLLALLLVLPAGAKPKILRTLKHGGSSEQYLAYSPDGRLLAAWLPGQIQLWNPATGKRIAVLDAKKRGFIGFSKDSRRIFTTSSGKVEGWSCPTLKKASAKPDGSYVAAARKWYFHGPTGFAVASPATVEYPFHSAYSQAGKTWAAVGYQVAQVYSFPANKLLWSSPDAGRDVTTVTLSPDGKRLAYGTMGASIFIQDLTQRAQKPIHLFADGEIRAIASNGRMLAVGCADSSSKIYLMDWDGKLSAVLSPTGGDIRTLENFRQCQQETGCIHFMIGRGALANPALPHQIAENWPHHLARTGWPSLTVAIPAISLLLAVRTPLPGVTVNVWTPLLTGMCKNWPLLLNPPSLRGVETIAAVAP